MKAFSLLYLLLTAHLSGLNVSPVDLRVQVDHKLIVIGNLGVAILNLLVDPSLEALTTHSEGHVDEPLTGHSQKVGTVGHVVSDPGYFAASTII